MRIVITNGFCYTYEGGVEKKIREFIPRLLKSGFDVTFVSPLDGTVTDDLIEGVEHVFLPSKRVKLPKISPPELQVALPDVKKLINEGDIVHNFNEYFGSFIYRFIKRPLIHYQQNVLTLKNSYKLHSLLLELVGRTVLKRFFKRCKAIVTLSDFLGNEMSRKFNVRPTLTIPCGIDIDTYKSSKKLGKEFREKWDIDKSFVLGVGRVVREKGFQNLLRVASDYDVTVGIAGDGYFVNNLKRIARKVGVDLRLFGWLKGKDLVAAYSASDFVVVPSLWDEPFGIVNLEAMSCSKPVLASRSGGIPEIIDDGVDGFLVDVSNEEEFREKFELLLNNKRLRMTMGKNGRRKVKKFYRWKVIVKRWKEVYESISN